jgi:hypothetical protein
MTTRTTKATISALALAAFATTMLLNESASAGGLRIVSQEEAWRLASQAEKLCITIVIRPGGRPFLVCR